MKERVRLVTEMVDANKERTLANLGVEAIWYAEHSELLGLLAKLRA